MFKTQMKNLLTPVRPTIYSYQFYHKTDNSSDICKGSVIHILKNIHFYEYLLAIESIKCFFFSEVNI